MPSSQPLSEDSLTVTRISSAAKFISPGFSASQAYSAFAFISNRNLFTKERKGGVWDAIFIHENLMRFFLLFYFLNFLENV